MAENRIPGLYAISIYQSCIMKALADHRKYAVKVSINVSGDKLPAVFICLVL